jgi:hypothetical protein
MQAHEGLNLEQIRAFLEASDDLGFKVEIGMRCTGGWI